jgi:hypothetical protein
MAHRAARPSLTLRKLSHDESVDAFAPTLEEFVEALRGRKPGEFVEAVVAEPLTVDDVRQRLERAAERLGWRLTWAHRAPEGVVRFRIEAAPARAPGRPR